MITLTANGDLVAEVDDATYPRPLSLPDGLTHVSAMREGLPWLLTVETGQAVVTVAVPADQRAVVQFDDAAGSETLAMEPADQTVRVVGEGQTLALRLLAIGPAEGFGNEEPA